MLTCVCRPVSSSFIDKQSIMGAPIDRDQIVVTSEPKTKIGTAKPIVNQNPQVPVRPSAAELKAMALRQQQQIDSNIISKFLHIKTFCFYS
ncbi:CLUMA_CG010432, isoform A [Clunio marinus]|uniref:CLUMA_CG010432, isoform A n=1 Tax=Clunio marinus TaxID=568069 RepID=A0A1J1I9D5_9DIPT|nr:CLUMA_CG010432, isoform A [Clunio marinus]